MLINLSSGGEAFFLKLRNQKAYSLVNIINKIINKNKFIEFSGNF